MTTDLVTKALAKAYSIRQSLKGLVFHGDRDSQYTSKRFRALLASRVMRASLGEVGACWGNAAVERFFGSLKHDWLLKIAQPTRTHIQRDVVEYMRYYNTVRLHRACGDLTPMA